MAKEDKKAKKADAIVTKPGKAAKPAPAAAAAPKAAKKAPAKADETPVSYSSAEQPGFATVYGAVEVVGAMVQIDIKRARSSKSDRVLVPLASALAYAEGTRESGAYVVSDHPAVTGAAFSDDLTNISYKGDILTGTNGDGLTVVVNTARLTLSGAVAI